MFFSVTFPVRPAACLLCLCLGVAVFSPRASNAEEPDAVTATVTRLLSTPIDPIWTITDCSAGGLEKKSSWDRPKFWKAPEGFTFLTALQHKSDLFALAKGPYGLLWLLRSSDEGTTWGTPAYLGEIPVSGRDRFHGSLEGLTIAVGEDLRIQFPSPCQIASAPLTRLLADADSDGLTDLYEQALVLDPQNADTDGDGLSDLIDPVPHVPSRQHGTVPAGLLWEVASRKYRVLSASSDKSTTLSGASRYQSILVIADRTLFCDPAPSERMIVLLPGEVKPAKQRLMYRFHMRVGVRQKDGHPELIWNQNGYAGGSGRVVHENGEWMLTKVLQWEH